MKLAKRGAQGPEVLFLQNRLQARGFFQGVADGIFGPATEASVELFQVAHNLKADGIVGDQTWSLLLVETRVTVPPALHDSEKEFLRTLLSNLSISNLGYPRLDVLHAAIDTLGWKESPPGSNSGPEIGQISNGYFPPEQEAKGVYPPWCALAVCYWLMKGLKVPSYKEIPFGQRLGGVAQIEDWAKKHGRVLVLAHPGAVFTMGRGGSGSDEAAATLVSGHTGLVVAVDPDNTAKVITIEGNTADSVCSLRRDITKFRMFVRWWG